MEFNPNILKSPFIDSVPQTSLYGIMFKKMFGVKNVLCVTFNDRHVIGYEPVKALEMCAEFYKDNSGTNLYPDWFLIP